MLTFLKRKKKLFPFLLRFLIGWFLLVKGNELATQEPRWSSFSLLSKAKGPLAEFFNAMAGQKELDALWIYGLIIIGIALLLGILTRAASFAGMIMSSAPYIAVYPPPGFFVDAHIIAIAIFLYLLFEGCGSFALDNHFKKLPFFKKHKNLRGLLG